VSRVTTVVITQDRLPGLRQTLPRHQPPVILVDNASSDGTPAWVAEHLPHVEMVRLAENRGAVARNVGVEAARTPYVAFADDDSWWAPGALEVAADLFDRHPRLAVLAGRILVGPEEREDPICAEMRDSPLGRPADLPGPEVLGFLACGAVVRREAFLAVSGFDEVVEFGGEEERVALDLRSGGWALCYGPEVVAHHHPTGGRDSARRAVRWHRNRILTTLMRRPWPVVAGAVIAAGRSGPHGRAGVRAAVRRAPAALARRRVLSPGVEAARRLLG
jgi:GT2 family glycosyltransferase